MSMARCGYCHQSTHSSQLKVHLRIMRRERRLGFVLWHRVTFCSLACLQAWLAARPG